MYNVITNYYRIIISYNVYIYFLIQCMCVFVQLLSNSYYELLLEHVEKSLLKHLKVGGGWQSLKKPRLEQTRTCTELFSCLPSNDLQRFFTGGEMGLVAVSTCGIFNMC